MAQVRHGVDEGGGVLPAIVPMGKDSASYDLVVIGTPIWSSNSSSPVRAFVKQYGDRIRETAFFCTGDGNNPEKVFKGMEELLGRKPQSTVALLGREREGDRVEVKITGFVESLLSSS